MELITSAQNPKVKRLLALQQKAAERRSSGLFVVEGRRELEHCLEAGLRVESVFACPEMGGEEVRSACARASAQGAVVSEVTPQVYEKMAYRGSTEGVVAVVEEKLLKLPTKLRRI